MSLLTTNISLLGGIPLKGQDLAASVIFLAFYAAVLFPLAAWRLASPATRCSVLVRPLLFVLARIAAFVVRAIQASGSNADTSLYIAEQILLLCGFILLCDPLLKLAGFHLERHAPPTAARRGGLRVLALLRLAILAALVLGVVAGSLMGSLDSSSSLHTLKACRDGNAILCLAVTASIGLTVAFWQCRGQNLPARAGLLLLAAAALLSVASGYRLFLYEKDPVVSPISAGNKAAFYSLSALPEALVTVLYLAFNVVELCDVRNGLAKQKESKAMRQAEKQGNAYDMGTPEPSDKVYYPPSYRGPQQV